MACELWVRGSAENGGVVNVDVPMGPWGVNRAFPVLTQAGTGQSQGRTYTFYTAVPGWAYGAAGWYSTPEFYVRGDCGVSPDIKHDCLNGNCIPSITYGTPGAFANRANCQAGCAKNSTCTGQCVSPEEIAALQQAANNLQSKICR